jgi:hypothetical protein
MTRTVHADLRILIGASSFADADAALSIVERLTETVCARLGGVLVEEETLEICQMPNQRVIQPSGTITLPPNTAQLRTLMQADARAFRKSLARTARPRGTEWVFAHERGDLVHASLLVAASWDVLVLGYRQVHKRRGTIIVFGTHGTGISAMDAIARRLSDHLHTERIYFEVNDVPEPVAARDVRFDILDDSLKALTHMNAEAVLVDLQQGAVRTQSDLARVLEAARCPVIVFGASATKSQLAHNTQIPPVVSQ